MKILFILFCLIANQSLAVASEALAKKVIELRKEVELLNDEYKIEREKVLTELKSLGLQKADLASNIRNEEIRKKQLTEKLQKIRKELGESSIESKELKPVLEITLQKLKEFIGGGLPFKTAERLQALNDLETKISKNEISPVRAANELWALIEDEKRLAKETSLHKQSLPINGKQYLAEVVKLGMLFLYFKTDNGVLGMAQRKGEKWEYTLFQSEDEKQKSLAFFESLKKQIRQGYFEIPTKLGSAHEVM